MAKKATKKKAAPKGAKPASKADDFRSHSADELSSQLSNLKKEQFNLRFQRANGQVENTGRIRTLRRDIARIQTVSDRAAPRLAGEGLREMPKRILQGTVVSDKNAKTVVVKVERRFIHPVMGKTVRRSKKYHAHDEKGEFKVGDVVRIQECRPISKLKAWEVLERVGK